MFSRRSDFPTEQNALTRAVAARRAAGLPIVDLTVSNPTEVGLEVEAAVLALLASPEGRHYRPEPRGLPGTREAIARYHRDRGADVSADQIIVTASTSEAYALCFMLLCDPCDRVLTPAPGYPLFDVLAQLHSVEQVPYPLHQVDGWSVDLHAVEQRLAEGRVKALLAVNPGNPTGAFLRQGESRALAASLRAAGAALVVDEVFGDYLLGPPDDLRLTLAGNDDVLTFCLSGLSKLVGLPQLKVGWIAVSGPSDQRDEALGRLEMMNDSFLSASTAAQLATPELLARREELSAPLRRRVRENLATLDAGLAAQRGAGGGLVQRLALDGGWYACLRVPRIQEDEQWCVALLERGLLVHPGYFFDFPSDGHLVISLLARPADFAGALPPLLATLEAG